MHSFTPEDLIQYVYNETSTQKSAAIRGALETDWKLREKYEEIISAQQALEKVTFSPRKKAIDNILAYAEKSLAHATEV
ncbi:hypothetical protein QWZ08_25685 [Ferruginibacter paludis]|uniref:hypothetical protein n=1 Tax=Ferruginibacter paludis TaxID=1310417 RepID=UPI0025B3C6C6|nr:hypothetical protein [Ferruginibacter paludis]MDN3659062.1 hypothetical protein [Ferruginibacter paludis]